MCINAYLCIIMHHWWINLDVGHNHWIFNGWSWQCGLEEENKLPYCGLKYVSELEFCEYLLCIWHAYEFNYSLYFDFQWYLDGPSFPINWNRCITGWINEWSNSILVDTQINNYSFVRQSRIVYIDIWS